MNRILSTLLFITSLIIMSCSKEEKSQIEQTLSTTYVLTFSSVEGGTLSTEGGTYESGSNITVNAIADPGYEFLNWSDGSTENPRVILVNSNLDLKANFKRLFLTFYKGDPFNGTSAEGDFSPTAIAVDLDEDGNEELILTYANPTNHKTTALRKKSPIKVVSYKEGRLVDVTSDYFNEIPSTYFTRQIFYEDLNNDGFKDLYFANHGAEPDDTSVFYVFNGQGRIDGVWAEQDLVFLRSGSKFIKADYFEYSDYSHGSNIIRFGNNQVGVLRNSSSPGTDGLGGKNSIVYFQDNQIKIDNTFSNIEEFLWRDEPEICGASLWMYPIDLDKDGLDEIVSETKVYQLKDGQIESYDIVPSSANLQGYTINEGGFVYDMDNDGDLDLVKSNTKTENCGPILGNNFISVYINQNGDLSPIDLPSYTDIDFAKNIAPFDVNFDGLMDIVQFGKNNPKNFTDPRMFLLNLGGSFEIREINTNQFDANILHNGNYMSIQNFPQYHISYFLKNNEGYVYITGTHNGMIAFLVRPEDLDNFLN